jgi:5'-nucleotidase
VEHSHHANCMLQLVQRMDQGLVPDNLGVSTYQGLWACVQKAMFQTHVESSLKQEIIQEPEKYVQLDSDLPAALLDMLESGKKLMLITNSDWKYTKSLMAFAYDRYVLHKSRPHSSIHSGHKNAMVPPLTKKC